MRYRWVAILMSSLLPFSVCAASKANLHIAPYTSTQTTLQNITPENELKRLMAGNARFVANKSIQRNLLQQAKTTSIKGQFPAAVILSCMDSRGSPEVIFDQGLGDVFSVRVAGNVVDADQIGGMEYATKAIGSKLIMVMGHTQCGAVKGACQNVQFGNLTQLLTKIGPAVTKIKTANKESFDCNQAKIVEDIAKQNVVNMMQQIQEKSPLIHEQLKNNQIIMVGAMHDLKNGKITFFDMDGNVLES